MVIIIMKAIIATVQIKYSSTGEVSIINQGSYHQFQLSPFNGDYHQLHNACS